MHVSYKTFLWHDRRTSWRRCSGWRRVRGCPWIICWHIHRCLVNGMDGLIDRGTHGYMHTYTQIQGPRRATRCSYIIRGMAGPRGMRVCASLVVCWLACTYVRIWDRTDTRASFHCLSPRSIYSHTHTVTSFFIYMSVDSIHSRTILCTPITQHSTQNARRADGDEVDNFDETILPVDFEKTSQILDDVRVFCLFVGECIACRWVGFWIGGM